MQLKDAPRWEKNKEMNTDPYGSGVVRYAERWANLMEERVVGEVTVADVARQASHDADTEGITGFMYGCAVSILSVVWELGEELRVWHNLDTQIQDEGERANEADGVLNPALLTIQTDNQVRQPGETGTL